MPPSVSLILPVYGHSARARASLATAADFLASLPGERGELIAVDDGSPRGDRLADTDLPPGARLLRLPRNRGKGAAVRRGVEAARGELLLVTDADLPFSLAPVPTTLAWLRDGADVVIGDRLHPESVVEAGPGGVRRLSSAVFTWMVGHLVGLDFPDTQCGYKGYRGEAARRLFTGLRIESFAFEVEVLARARRAGYAIRRQPLRLLVNEESSVRLWKHAPRVALDTLRIALDNRRRGGRAGA